MPVLEWKVDWQYRVKRECIIFFFFCYRTVFVGRICFVLVKSRTSERLLSYHQTRGWLVASVWVCTFNRLILSQTPHWANFSRASPLSLFLAGLFTPLKCSLWKCKITLTLKRNWSPINCVTRSLVKLLISCWVPDYIPQKQLSAVTILEKIIVQQIRKPIIGFVRFFFSFPSFLCLCKNPYHKSKLSQLMINARWHSTVLHHRVCVHEQ